MCGLFLYVYLSAASPPLRGACLSLQTSCPSPLWSWLLFSLICRNALWTPGTSLCLWCLLLSVGGLCAPYDIYWREELFFFFYHGYTHHLFIYGQCLYRPEEGLFSCWMTRWYSPRFWDPYSFTFCTGVPDLQTVDFCLWREGKSCTFFLFFAWHSLVSALITWGLAVTSCLYLAVHLTR